MSFAVSQGCKVNCRGESGKWKKVGKAGKTHSKKWAAICVCHICTVRNCIYVCVCVYMPWYISHFWMRLTRTLSLAPSRSLLLSLSLSRCWRHLPPRNIALTAPRNNSPTIYTIYEFVSECDSGDNSNKNNKNNSRARRVTQKSGRKVGVATGGESRKSEQRKKSKQS